MYMKNIASWSHQDSHRTIYSTKVFSIILSLLHKATVRNFSFSVFSIHLPRNSYKVKVIKRTHSWSLVWYKSFSFIFFLLSSSFSTSVFAPYQPSQFLTLVRSCTYTFYNSVSWITFLDTFFSLHWFKEFPLKVLCPDTSIIFLFLKGAHDLVSVKSWWGFSASGKHHEIKMRCLTWLSNSFG